VVQGRALVAKAFLAHLGPENVLCPFCADLTVNPKPKNEALSALRFFSACLTLLEHVIAKGDSVWSLLRLSVCLPHSEATPKRFKISKCSVSVFQCESKKYPPPPKNYHIFTYDEPV